MNLPSFRIMGAVVSALLITTACSAPSTDEQETTKDPSMTMNTRFASADDVAPPVVEKRPVEIEQHGQTRTDNYQWLRDDNWQEVLREPSKLKADIRGVLQAENKYYEALTDDIGDLRETLFNEMRGRTKEDDASVPSKDGPWRYGVKYRSGGEYPVYVRIPTDGGDEQVLIDGDAESVGSEFYSVSGVTQSPDHSLIAYAEDRLGSEFYTIKVRNAQTGENLTDEIASVDGDGVAWAADSTGFFYIERDDNQRPSRARYHALGDDPANDRLVYEETQDGFFLEIYKSQNGKFVFIHSESQITSEVHFIRADDPGATPTLIAARENGIEYSLEHYGDDFLIRTNADGAVDFKVVRAPVATPARDNWSDWIAHQPGVYIASVIPYKDYIVRYERRDARPSIVISDYAGNSHEVSFDEAAYSLGLRAGYEFDTDNVRFVYESPSTPEQTFDYNMATRERTLLKIQEVPSGHDPSLYVVERIDAPAVDGAKIPVMVLRLKSTPLDGTAPAMLYGYGSYGVTVSDSFSPNILSMVDRGVIYAIAHVRGGAAMGRRWYQDGKLDKKMNSFTDFNAAADALIAGGYSSEKNIVIYGGSAGGLLVAAAVNLRPELYAGVIAAVPFIDVINTISDGELPLTPPEWEEWGNPITSAEEYGWIAEYSPYENIQSTNYPPIMATAGLADYRVTYWEPAKWVARLRDDATGGPFTLRTNMGAGHGGSAARFQRMEERAHLYAFALKALGVEDVEPVKHGGN